MGVAPPDRGSHTMIQRTPNVHFEGPQHFKHHRNSTRKRLESENLVAGDEKKAKFWASTPLGPHASGPPPPFGTPTLRGPHLVALNFSLGFCFCFLRLLLGRRPLKNPLLPLINTQNVCTVFPVVCVGSAAVFHVCVVAVVAFGASFVAFADPFGAAVCVIAAVFTVFFCFCWLHCCCLLFSVLCVASASLCCFSCRLCCCFVLVCCCCCCCGCFSVGVL